MFIEVTLANKITIGRLFIIPVFIAVILNYTPEREFMRWLALAIYVLAGITDVVDGYVARRFSQSTKLGSILDPLTDKLLFMSALLCLYWVGSEYFWPVRMPLWMVVVFISRDVILVSGALFLEFRFGLFEIRSNVWGKISAFLQIVCIIFTLLQYRWVLFVWWGALFAVVFSGIVYVREGVKVIKSGHS